MAAPHAEDSTALPTASPAKVHVSTHGWAVDAADKLVLGHEIKLEFPLMLGDAEQSVCHLHSTGVKTLPIFLVDTSNLAVAMRLNSLHTCCTDSLYLAR